MSPSTTAIHSIVMPICVSVNSKVIIGSRDATKATSAADKLRTEIASSIRDAKVSHIPFVIFIVRITIRTSIGEWYNK
jgi:hypothetical protein